MDKIIFFITLVLFPFGQLFKIGIFNLFDIAVISLAVVTFLLRPKYPEWYKYFFYFLLFCLFSLFFNYSLFTIQSLLYLVRLWSYSMIAVCILNNKDLHKKITVYLIFISVVSAIFGWLQYFIWPDLTALKYLGWDDHLLRMIGTFLDPTYLGLIFVLGIVLAYDKFSGLVYFLLLSLAFTYSRSSFVALAIVFLFEFIKTKRIKKSFIYLISFLFFLFIVPKGIGEGTNLTRTASGNNKLVNYVETIQIIKNSPLFGVGFNNICKARFKYLNDSNFESHSCNGSDSSILFLLATTGVVGFIMFVNFITKVFIQKNNNGFVLQLSLIAVLIHSLFANSLFYPHIMFWIFSLIGLQTESNSKSS